MSLEDQVRQFAESVRLALLAEIAGKESDTSTAKIIGINDKGNIKIENKGVERIGKGIGSAYQPGASRVIFDKTGSVEYKKSAKKTSPALAPVQPLKKIKPNKVISSGLIIPVEILEEEEEIFEVPTTGFMVNLYTKRIPLNHYASVGSLKTSGTQQESQIASSISQPAYPATSNTKGIVMEAAEATVNSFGNSGSVSITGPLTGTSASVAGFSGLGQDWQIQSDGPAFTKQTGDSRKYTTWNYEWSIPPSNFNLSSADMSGASGYKTLPDPTYFYSGGGGLRQVNLSDHVSGDIVNHEVWHNFVTIESNEVIAYTVFFVSAADFSTLEEVPNGNFPIKEWLYGPISHYWLHLRLNITTGKAESKRSAATPYSAVAGGGWAIKYSYAGRFFISDSPFGGYYNQYASAFCSAVFYDSKDSDEYYKIRYSFLPDVQQPDLSGIFSNAYPGDWISSWSITNSGIATDTIKNFLAFSYKNGKYYKNADTLMPPYWDNLVGNQPMIYEYEPSPASAYYEGAGGNTANVVSFINEVISQGTSYTYEDFFDGSRGNNDTNTIHWSRILEAWITGGTDPNYIYGRKGPSLSIPVLDETTPLHGGEGSSHGDRMHRDVWTSYVPVE